MYADGTPSPMGGYIKHDDKHVYYRDWASSAIKSFPINAEDIAGLDMWRTQGWMIQTALIHWDEDKRELMLTGMDNDAWERMQYATKPLSHNRTE